MPGLWMFSRDSETSSFLFLQVEMLTVSIGCQYKGWQSIAFHHLYMDDNNIPADKDGSNDENDEK